MNKRIEPGRKTSIAYIRQVMVCLLLGSSPTAPPSGPGL